jgi:hypothetical protein
MYTESGALVAPVANFFQTFAAALLEQTDTVAAVFEFVDVGPDFGLPLCIVHGGFSAAGTAGVQSANDGAGSWLVNARKLNKDAAHFLDIIVGVNDVFVTQQVSKAQFVGFRFSLGAGVERAILGPQLFHGIASHPEGFLLHG